ncbi:hypothetical protein Tco_0440035 [Tanacetum coccineum]
MDSMIPNGQKNTLAEYMILYGADNRPPMLDKDFYDSWKSKMVTRAKKYAELSAIEKIQADCDLKATNIILQGLPSDIYSLINHHRVATDLQEKVQLLMQGEGRMARQCPKLKRKRDVTWFRDKVLLVEAQGKGKILNEEELEFLADPGIAKCPVTQSVITHNAAYQADDLDVYDIDYDEISTAKAVLMANLSSYGSDVLSKLSNQVTNCNKVNEDNLIANETLSAELKRYKERIKMLEERQNVDLGTREKLIIDDIIRNKDTQFTGFEKEFNSLKQTLSEQLKEKESLTKTLNVFKNESKEKEAKNIDNKIALEKKVKELDNIMHKMALGFQNPFYLKKAQQIRPMLYDGSVIAKETNVISIADSEETLMLEEES